MSRRGARSRSPSWRSGRSRGRAGRVSGRDGAEPPPWLAGSAGARADPRGRVECRPLRRADGAAWMRTRLEDEHLIAPWDATSELSWADRHSRTAWLAHRRMLRVGRPARRGGAVGDHRRRCVRGSGHAGRGPARRPAVGLGRLLGALGTPERGVATAAVALLVAHGFGPVGLHRIEATIAPENVASQRVVEHLRFRLEGNLERYLDINGAWRDHLLYALTVEEVSGGLPELLARWHGSG